MNVNPNVSRRRLLGGGITAGAAVVLAAPRADAATPPGTVVPVPARTSDYTASPGDYVPVDASAGSVTITLPTAPVDQSQVAVLVVGISGSYVVRMAAGGSDVIHRAGGPTSLELTSLYQETLLQYDADDRIWYVLGGYVPLNDPLGAAQLGADGAVGGPGGSPLSTAVAITSSANTFEAPQTFTSSGGTGTGLTLQPAPGDTTVESYGRLHINAYAKAIGAVHTHDLSSVDSNPHDLVDLTHRSTGDAVFAAHLGGILPDSFSFTAEAQAGSAVLSSVSSFAGLLPGTPISGAGIAAGTTIASAPNVPGAGQIEISQAATGTAVGQTITVTKPAGTSGGDALFNGLIPYYLDDPGSGRRGSVPNNRTGMRGLYLQNQPPGNRGYAVLLQNWAAGAALRIENQNNSGGSPQGTGQAVDIQEHGSRGSITVSTYTQVASNNGAAVVDLRANWPASGSSAKATALQVVDSASTIRFLVDTAGALFTHDGQRNRVVIQPAGDPVFKILDPGGIPRLQVASGGTLALTDSNIALSTNIGTKIGTAATQKLGFFNADPVPQPSSVGTTSGFSAGSGPGVLAGSGFTGGLGRAAYTVGDIVRALKQLGLIAA